MKKIITQLIIALMLSTTSISAQNCDLLETVSYTGFYSMEQITPTIFGYDTFLDGFNNSFELFSVETDATQVSPGILLADNQRSFDASYIAVLDFNNLSTYIIDFTNCEVTFGTEQTTGLTCAGGGVVLGPAPGGSFDANDDMEFNLVFQDDVTDDCGQGTPDVEIKFTRSPEVRCIDDLEVINDPSNNSCSENVTFSDILAFDIDGSPLSVTQTQGLPSGSDFPVGITRQVFSATSLINGITTICSFLVEVEDQVDPTITCPADVILNIGGNYSAPLPSYLFEAVANDNCDSTLIISQDPQPDTIFNAGDIVTVSLTVRDESLNTASCTFLVTFDSTLAGQDNSLMNAVTIAPNPAADFVEVRQENPALEIKTIELVDIRGSVLQTQTIRDTGMSETIDLQNYATGIYFIRIFTESETFSHRIIKR